MALARRVTWQVSVSLPVLLGNGPDQSAEKPERTTMHDKRVLDRRHFLITAATGASVSGSVLTSSTCAAADVGAVAGRRDHPVLIRNDHSGLIHVVVEVAQPDVHATSFTFSLRGTDELNDIESLRLFYSGDKGPQELDKVRGGTSFSGDRQALLAELTSTPFGQTRGAKPYYDYFGEAAGDPEKGHYSYDLGDWHLISLNTVCKKIGGCDEDSQQYRWLVEDLKKTDNNCVLGLRDIVKCCGRGGSGGALFDQFSILEFLSF